MRSSARARTRTHTHACVLAHAHAQAKTQSLTLSHAAALTIAPACARANLASLYHDAPKMKSAIRAKLVGAAIRRNPQSAPQSAIRLFSRRFAQACRQTGWGCNEMWHTCEEDA
eukprot:9919797-Alexandrium_andersonii.AAC.1